MPPASVSSGKSLGTYTHRLPSRTHLLVCLRRNLNAKQWKSVAVNHRESAKFGRDASSDVCTELLRVHDRRGLPACEEDSNANKWRYCGVWGVVISQEGVGC